MNGFNLLQEHQFQYVEVDPTGRYGRYDEILGKGSSKTVYRAFDEYEGIEVAWNQVKLYDFLQSPEDLERLYCEIHLLKTLKHRNIMKFYTSWVDTVNRNINFVTEMFTSGTLRQYRQKHKKVNIRALKHWCRQILKGLLYLHSLEPPVIHRDLKCDNIFVNGNQGEVKIGDLGLAAILRKSHAARCVGTPEFMAPEVYAEEYNELVDIYAFGMCILEMVTFEYPYSECTTPAQIYKKVTSGKKPDALYKVTDPEVRRFVEKCLATVSCRLTARELLDDPFLQIDDCRFDSSRIDYFNGFVGINPMLRQPLLRVHNTNDSLTDGFYTSNPGYEHVNELNYHPYDYEHNEIELFTSQDDERLGNVDITIEGKRREDDGIFLRLRMADKEGCVRNIYFPFDMETDTPMSVAAEMVAELDITDQDVTKIANMIESEIFLLVPEWKRVGLEEIHNDKVYCQNCDSTNSLANYISSHDLEAKNLQVLQCSRQESTSPSNKSLANYLSSHDPEAKNLQVLQCSKHGCTAVHGRFEEITYKFEESSKQCQEPLGSSPSDIRGPQDEDESINESPKNENPSPATRDIAVDYENEIRQEMRWLKAKYQMQLRELRDQQLGIVPKASNAFWDRKEITKKDRLSSIQMSCESDEELMKSFASGKHFGSWSPEGKCGTQERVENRDGEMWDPKNGECCSPVNVVTAKSFYGGALLPQPLYRATSLPVDAVDV